MHKFAEAVIVKSSGLAEPVSAAAVMAARFVVESERLNNVRRGLAHRQEGSAAACSTPPRTASTSHASWPPGPSAATSGTRAWGPSSAGEELDPASVLEGFSNFELSRRGGGEPWPRPIGSAAGGDEPKDLRLD